MKLIDAVSILQLVSLLKLLYPKRIALRLSSEFEEALAVLILFKSFIRVVQNDMLFWQRRK